LSIDRGVCGREWWWCVEVLESDEPGERVRMDASDIDTKEVVTLMSLNMGEVVRMIGAEAEWVREDEGGREGGLGREGRDCFWGESGFNSGGLGEGV
jgi:hypothetical protein